ncbi:MAG: hypothetical protein KY455_08810 [Euryarchaeota archaeon]|nr:hypothetical protein [Euryarchaeota archaeon]
MKKTLEAVGIESRSDEEDHSVRVPVEVRVTDNIETAWMWMERLMEIYEEVREAAADEGIEVRPYKPVERHVLLATGVGVLRSGHAPVTRGMFIEMLHRYVWNQGLPNTNHRSTVALVLEVMDHAGLVAPAPEDVLEVSETFAKESKPLIQKKEAGYDPETLRVEHHRASAKAIDALLPRD